MALEDPFFVVKEEVERALEKTKGLFSRWKELNNEKPTPVGSSLIESQDGLTWTITELRNSLRSIEWDLEDLDETIAIVQGNPKKFRITESQINERKQFVDQTRDEIKAIRDRLSSGKTEEKKIKQSGLILGPCPPSPPTTGNGQYMRLTNQDSPAHFITTTTTLPPQQFQLENADDDRFHMLQHSSVNSFKSTSDEQAIMLDDSGHPVMVGPETMTSSVQITLKRVAKKIYVPHDRRQWLLIGTLTVVMLVLFVIFFALPGESDYGLNDATATNASRATAGEN